MIEKTRVTEVTLYDDKRVRHFLFDADGVLREEDSRTPQRSCRAAHGAKHLPLCAAAIRRRRLSQWGIETRH